MGRLYQLTPSLCILALITAIHIVYLWVFPHGLFFDEAQYWIWAKQPDFGYYSKPPMVAWMIAITTSLCGDGEACVRLSSSILHFFTSLTIYAIAAILFDRRTAFWSAITYITLPAVTLSSLLISTDPSLLLFWALTLLCFTLAIKKGQWYWWILAGIAGGLGMMSKYNMVMLPAGFFLFLLATQQQRHQLKHVFFWAAAAIAALIFLPNILWNASHGFVSFLHTKDNANLQGISLHFDQMAEFFFAQFGVFGPVLFASLLLALIPKDRFQNQDYRLLWCSIAPLFLLILLISLLSRAHANWAAPVYVGATIAVVARLLARQKQRWLVVSLAIHLCFAIGIYHFDSLRHLAGFELSGKKTSLQPALIKDPFKRLKGWETLAKEVQKRHAAYPDTILLTASRQLHSEFMYYMQPTPPTIKKWSPTAKIKDHFDLTASITDDPQQRYFFISRWFGPERLEKHFSSVIPLEAIVLSLYPDEEIRYHVMIISGYKGTL